MQRKIKVGCARHAHRDAAAEARSVGGSSVAGASVEGCAVSSAAVCCGTSAGCGGVLQDLVTRRLLLLSSCC